MGERPGDPSAQPGEERTPLRRLAELGLLVACYTLALLPFLGQGRVIASNEMRHMEIAREMSESGDFVVPRLLGEAYCDKPPIYHAVAALTYRAAGYASLFLGRLPSALAGLLLGIVTWRLARAFLDPRGALCTALLLGGLPGFAYNMRIARPDALFALFVITSCLCLLRAGGSGRPRNLAWGLLAGASLGGALLCKGPVALLFVLAFAFFVPRRLEGHAIRAGAWLAVVVGGLVVAGGWAALVLDAGARSYLEGVLGQGDLPWSKARGTGGLSPSLFYIVPLASYGLFLLPFAWLVVKDARRRGGGGFVGASLVCLVVLSLVEKKRAHYLLPLYPLLSLATVDAVWREGSARVRNRLLPGLAFLGLALVPVRFGALALIGGGNDRAMQELIDAVRATVDPGDRIVVDGKLAVSVAFLLPNDHVVQVEDAEGLLEEMAKDPPHVWYLMSVPREEELAPDLGPGVKLEPATADYDYSYRDRGPWRLSRVVR